MIFKSYDLRARCAHCYWYVCSQAISVCKAGEYLYLNAYLHLYLLVYLSIVTEIYESIWMSSIPIKYRRVLYSFFPFCICKSLSWRWETLLPLFLIYLFVYDLYAPISCPNKALNPKCSAPLPWPSLYHWCSVPHVWIPIHRNALPTLLKILTWLDLTWLPGEVLLWNSVQFSHSVVSDSLQSHRLQHARLRCPSPTPGVCSNPVIDSCHRVGEAIQPSHPLLSPSPPAFNLSQHRGLFQRVSSSHQVTKVLEFQLQHQSFQWIFRTDFLGLSLGLQENGVKRAYALA